MGCRNGLTIALLAAASTDVMMLSAWAQEAAPNDKTRPAQNARAQRQSLPTINVQSRRRPPARRRPVARPPQPRPPSPPPALEAERGTGPVRGYVAKQSVTATKTDTPIIETPQSISVVPRDQIEAQQAESIKQALRYTAGVASENRANFAGFDIIYSRGFPLKRYLDGLRIPGDALFMTPQPELYGMERVEVLRGPSSVLYGQSSPAGLVNMVSKRPTETPFREVMLQAGSYNRLI